MQIKNPPLMRAALFNLTDHSGASDEYCKGLVVGMITVIMAVENISHKDAMQTLTYYLPAAESYREIPEEWWK